MMPMQTIDMEFFKNLLLQWRNDLLYRADDTVEVLLNSGDNLGDNLTDPLDRASFETDRGTEFRFRDRESMLIKKINQSLEDIKNGEYGIC
jgi:DnaK suppressor protein